MLIEVTKTDESDVEILEANVLAHSKDHEEILDLMVKSTAQDVAVEWCGEIDSEVTRVKVVIDTGATPLEQAVQQIIAWHEQRGVLARQ